jgi:hypothetical protein
LAVSDPQPGAAVANAWRSYRACLESAPAWATHLLVIQDDATVCRHFAVTLHRIARAHPDRVVCLFVGGAPARSAERVRHAGARDERYAELDPSEWLPCVATLWPTAMIGPLLEFVDERMWRQGHLGDDHRLGEFVRHSHITALATVPNLVQHEDRVPSLIGTHALAGLNPARVSCCYIGDHDPRELDWNKGSGPR